ncbi:hypothetical protein BP5796_04153 [Coleophoma crateriformis]|uniref:Zn(2)-C6 fungal-type domain-containing protein n=1 Tax=Coleophoma crateriformis TaxID=565419 RepID=A0A3D8SJ64_9HELO|nr:hypothetical protein BP5796_04153 [Coleophoma crateriformis]
MEAPRSPALPPPKQIRFVNNEGQPPAKRRRINAACRTCRKRKTRCDGTRPICSTCVEGGHDCLGYEPEGKEGRRGHRGSDAKIEDDEDESKEILHHEYDDGRMRSVIASPALFRTHSSHSYIGNNYSPESREREPLGRKIRDTPKPFNEYREAPVFSPDGPSTSDRSPPSLSESHRVPYFRYFGPTAIVPGFKQMVVSVREHRRSTGAGSAIGMSPGSGGGSVYAGHGTPSQAGTEPRSSVEMPIYDPTDHLPVNRLIIHLVEMFFVHLGCNYPFLRQDKFVRMVEEKQIEAILVDAVCALAARFSDHPLLTVSHDSNYPKSEYGHVFAQRAKGAVVDTFPAPSVAAVQACLLLAYEGFGAGQDSALWMYLGCAIRMAVDLGLQKLDGVKHQGQKDPQNRRASIDGDTHSSPEDQIVIIEKERAEIEQERIDTLWTVFMLDRVISSGTGRPVTLRDDDFELSFPTVISNPQSGWPNPFPALIQIIQLYGRVSDLLNNIRDVKDVTTQKMEGLSAMEKDLTQLYQRLDQRLNFNASNFQHYVKSGEGTNFILVHFWFHTLIMLLHQPTLMHSFEGQILQLLPNSRELSMSSAKTIADILAFAELIDPRSFIGNPFTSQPMYIAACAFLMEQAAHTSSQPTSRDASPPKDNRRGEQKGVRSNGHRNNQAENKQKHSLLASAANQNYQRCYKSLQQLETYWAGTRYILVALDQKAKGIWDPETYTEQEMEATKLPKADMIPSWRRKLSFATSPGRRFADFARSPKMEMPGSPAIDAQAIGWSLTGTTNSPSSNLTFMYQSMNGPDPVPPAPSGPANMIYDPIRQSLPEATPGSTSTSDFHTKYQSYQQKRPPSRSMPPPVPKYNAISPGAATTSEAEMLLGLQNSPFAQTPGSQHSFDRAQNITSPSNQQHNPSSTMDFSQTSGNNFPGGGNGYMGIGGVGDMMMESQEIDMSALGGDMMPWLEYLPQDVLNFFDNGNANGMSNATAMTGNME